MFFHVGSQYQHFGHTGYEGSQHTRASCVYFTFVPAYSFFYNFMSTCVIIDLIPVIVLFRYSYLAMTPAYTMAGNYVPVHIQSPLSLIGSSCISI